MGLFDNLIKALEDGNIEKTLSGAVDRLESSLDKAAEKAEQAASVLEKHGENTDKTTDESPS